jgi:gliding motility-associated-like protein
MKTNQKISGILIVVFLFVSYCAECQVTFEKKYVQNCNAMLPFMDGRFLVTGYSNNKLAFVFCDSNGDTISEKGYVNGVEYIKGMAIGETATGIYVAGEISQGNSTINDIMILKIDANAQVLWTKRFGIADSGMVFRKLVFDASGNVLILSRFASKNEFCLTSVNSDGVLLWSKRYTDQAGIDAESIAYNSLGQIVVCGFNPLNNMMNYPYKKGNLVIATLTSNGIPLWGKLLEIKTLQNNDLEGCLLDVVSRDGVSYFAGLVTNDLTSEAMALSVDNQGNIINKNFFSSTSNMCKYYGFSNLMFHSNGELVFSGGGYAMGCQKSDMVSLNLSLDTIWTRSYPNLGSAFMMNGAFLLNKAVDGGFFMTNSTIAKFDGLGRIHCFSSTPLIPLDYNIIEAPIQINEALFEPLTNVTLSETSLALNYFEYCSDTCLVNCNPTSNDLVFQLSIPDTICANSCIAIVASAIQSNSVFSWDWTFEGANPQISNLAQPQNICYSQPGEYAIRLHITSTGGLDTLIESVIQVVDVKPALEDHQICQNQTVELNTNISDATYLWSTGETTPAITVGVDGYYLVTVSKNNCSRMDTSMVDVVSAPYFQFNNSYSICPEEKLMLSGPSGSNYQFLWSNGTTNQTIEVNQPGMYWLQATNSCGSYTDSTTLAFRLDCNQEFFIPTAFEPNEDGKNDRFVITGKNIFDYSITIYSRWGEQLFQSNDITNSWDGKSKGKECPVGVYTYRIEYKNIKGEKQMKMGNVTLVR